ncbi:uncharacterized protein LOC124420564 [Lucilia cuprina]|uniref:uncharacterized protein LOC124420564 n=1 Tax=Lucilia cuprina TaxID=7375 RepID=UPI001F05EA66|nr:uncharacterized protein LOC124420564 [Lucilia cuprina]
MNDEMLTDDLENSDTDDLLDNILIPNIHLMRCAAHTLQLCVVDLHKQNDLKYKIEVARNAAKSLRTSKNRLILKKHNQKIPSLDVITRWNSTYTMIKSLNEIREFIDENNLLEVPIDWEWINMYLQTMEPIWNVTMKFQKEQFPLCELFKLWMNLKRGFQLSQFEMQKLISQIMNGREHFLLDNVTLLSAVYLDPRLNLLLTATQKLSAKSNLKNIAKRIQTIREINGDDVEANRIEQIPDIVVNENCNTNENDFLTSLMNEIESENTTSNSYESFENLLEVYNKIENFENIHKRLPIDTNIFFIL